MTWIATIEPADAGGMLAELYARAANPDGQIDQIIQAHSQRPHTLKGHLALYRNALHHPANTVPAWFLEAIGVRVSRLNRCAYCVAHHEAGMRRLLGDEEHTAVLLAALTVEPASPPFAPREVAALDYAAALTLAPGTITRGDIDRLRAAGWDDGEILEINQVAAYFAYANRTVLGLGVDLAGEKLGDHPAVPPAE